MNQNQTQSKPADDEQPTDEGLDVTICSAFSEITLKTPGWYFFYPKHPHPFERPKFVHVEESDIEDGWLHCKKYAGTYMGPIIPPSLPNVQALAPLGRG